MFALQVGCYEIKRWTSNKISNEYPDFDSAENVKTQIVIAVAGCAVIRMSWSDFSNIPFGFAALERLDAKPNFMLINFE